MTLIGWLRSALAPRPAFGRKRPIRRLAVEGLEDRLTPSTGGVLDPTFGSGGHVLSSFTNNYDAANAVTVQPDGKIVIAGITETSGSQFSEDFLVARYNADGSPDTGFGSGGHTATGFGSTNNQANAVALQTQTNGTDKILAAGFTVTTKKGAVYDDFALARYNANGTLDTTFGTNKKMPGEVTTDLGSSGQAFAMAVDASGRIIVAGWNGADNAALVRYTPNGALDTSFASGGILQTSIRFTSLPRLALQTDGKIVLGGTTPDPTTSTEFVMARFNANGTVDSGFGSSGVVTAQPGYTDHFGGVALQGDGKIVVSGSEASGYSPHALYLLRFNTNGTPDTTFGTSGVEAVPSPGRPSDGGIDAQGSEVAIQADGKVVAGGQFYDTTAQQRNLATLRVNSNGTVDTGYGSGGWATVQFASADSLDAIAIQPDGRILLAGYAQPTSNTLPVDVALVRFLSSAPQIGSFAATSNPDSSVTLTVSSFTDGNPNATVTQVAIYADSNGDGQFEPGSDALLGFAMRNADGTWSLTVSTAAWASGSNTLFAQATDSLGAVGDPFALTFTLQVVTEPGVTRLA